MNDPISPERLARAIHQLREDVLNARECEDDTIEVLTDAVETLLAVFDRLTTGESGQATRAIIAEERADGPEAALGRVRKDAAELEQQIAEAVSYRAEVDRLTAELAKAHSTVTALTQTIRAYPDAVANDAANLAHARAMRAEAVAVARRIWRGETHPNGEPAWLTYEPQPIAAEPTAAGDPA